MLYNCLWNHLFWCFTWTEQYSNYSNDIAGTQVRINGINTQGERHYPPCVSVSDDVFEVGLQSQFQMVAFNSNQASISNMLQVKTSLTTAASGKRSKYFQSFIHWFNYHLISKSFNTVCSMSPFLLNLFNELTCFIQAFVCHRLYLRPPRNVLVPPKNRHNQTCNNNKD